MKACIFCSRATLVLVLIVSLWALGSPAQVVFTNDTTLDLFNTNYDGYDIVVSNCTLTVDGPHGFLSLLVSPGATVTHSSSPNSTHFEANEPHTLTSTNPSTLNYAGMLIGQTVTDAGGSLTYTQDVDYVMLFPGYGFIQIARTLTSSIPDGATVLVSYTVQAVASPGLILSITGNVQVVTGGVIDASGRGYSGGGGPGAGRIAQTSPADGSGGSYGGLGGTSSSNAVANATYGLYDHPAILGSGGGNAVGGSGAPGGGLINITAGGNVNIDGAILANGLYATNSRSGGGSGGSIWLIASSVSGAGSITANGGAGEPIHGGGGGGGRISIQAGTNNFSGLTTAYGGGGWQSGGAGTVFTSPLNGSGGVLLVDNGGRAGTNTLLGVNNGMDVMLDVMLRNAGVITTTPWSVHNLTIGSNAFLQVVSLTQLYVNATGSITVQPGGTLTADRAGYAAATGPGFGQSGVYQGYTVCGGGGHGGYGGSGVVSNAFGGNVYDSQVSPSQFGSGGGYNGTQLSGSGGGSIHLVATRALQVDGRLSANGGDGTISGGGGSGGSIWVTAGTVSGSGSINANGGNGADSLGGGGGGGRIQFSVSTNAFIGTIAAYGGGGANSGGAGPIYIQVSSPLGGTNQLIVDNGGRTGTNSAIQPATTSTALIIRNGGAAVENFPPLTFGSLFIGSNSWLVASAPGGNYPGQVNLTISGNATIQAGGGIITDAMGSAGGLGPGAGRVVYSITLNSAGGGGHGGYGGQNTSSQLVGGMVYDSTSIPNINGSGGGQLLPNYIGGAGGGWVRLIVSGTLQMDGRLSANGGGASGLGGGGGSGGSVWLTLGKLSGTGSITANGGNGIGGGGGGRISISFNTNAFAGVVSAYGSGPTNWGGAGSIYIKTNNQTYATVVLDNGGNRGTNSGFIDVQLVDLTITGGSVAASAPGSQLHNLLIRSNGTFAPFTRAGTSQSLSVFGNATIDAGGGISLDGLGYGYGSGPGHGYGAPSGTLRGGAGHGGFGAGNPTSTTMSFGLAYDSIVAPATAGSGGGGTGTSVAPFGGAGGGALRLTISDGSTLTVNGRISVNGKDGDSTAGGGSGGALWLTTGTVAGSGVISASGGAGPGAGGGGGGRISITCSSNRFTGQLTAAGGNGMLPGGAGTIYLAVNTPAGSGTGQLLIDNAGLAGASTPLATSYAPPTSPFNLTISGGGFAVPFSPLPLLSNLTVGAGSVLSGAAGQSNLMLAVLGNVNVVSNGTISVAGCGYPQSQGPGAGSSLSRKGAGGGYGGIGGASASGAAGGTNYGSAAQPIDRGSGGGVGANLFTGGSDGGGALRLSAGGTVNIDGMIRADGNIGIQDDSGGGSGGSLWINASQISGAGALTANGGNGDLYGGGGGGGGRIAIYSPMNTYTGLVTMIGGAGANPGQDGTLYVSSNSLPFLVVSSSPAGVVSNLVSFVDLTLNDAVNPYTLSVLGFTLFPHGGPPLPPQPGGMTAIGPSTVRVSFPVQNIPGDYLFTVRSGITNLLGQPISQVYTGAFTITIPTISGTITDTNGVGVADVLLQVNNASYLATTDPSGYYSLGVPPGWTGTVTPTLGTSMFVPSFLSFTNVSAPLTGQDFVMVPTIAPLLSSTITGGSFNLSWYGIAGVTYQAYSSTNLADWQPIGGPLPGTNGLMQLVTPASAQPIQFLRIQASD